MNKFAYLIVAAMVVAATTFTAAAEEIEPARGSRGLWLESKAMWQTPKSYPVKSMDKKGDVKAVAIDGEMYKGKPTRFFAYWALPEGASPTNKVPGIVLVHGGAGTAFDSWVRLWTKRGYAAIAMDNCGSLPEGIREFGGRLRHKMSGPEGWGCYADANLPAKDQWPFQAISTVIRSHSFLRSIPEVDPSRIGVTGISWGGYLTACVSGIDDRFAFAVPVYGCAYLYDHSVWSKEMKGLGETGKRWDNLWDARHYLPHAKMPMLWTTGSNDHFFPLDSLQRGYDLTAADPTLAVIVRMGHGYAPSGDPKEITRFADQIVRGGKKIPTVKAVKNGDSLELTWNADARKVKTAQLIWTESRDEVWEKRYYKTREVPFEGLSLKCAIPPAASVAWVNLICDDGTISSSRHFEID